VHHLFYLLLGVQPLTGYLSSSFSGYDTRFFGVPLPSWGYANPPLNQFFTDLHVAGSVLLAALVGVHVIGTIVHLLQPGERMLRRMLPW
jgi:cytochrome b561